jgi:hypothetical protein
MDIFLALNAAYLVLVGLIFTAAKPDDSGGTRIVLAMLVGATALVFFSIYYI